METDTPMIGCLCLWCGHQGSCSPCILKQSVLKEGHGHWIPAFTHIFTPTVSVSLDVWLIKGSHILDGRIARILWLSHSAISYRDRRKGMTPLFHLHPPMSVKGGAGYLVIVVDGLRVVDIPLAVCWSSLASVHWSDSAFLGHLRFKGERVDSLG